MRKIIWGEVMPEVTRKCQLHCPHCCRGDAQNVDMSKEIVDAFLNQTAAIRILEFAGGEPTLNIEIMDYWISEMKRRDIPLGGIIVFTNAIELSESVKRFYQNAYAYIDFCRKSKKIFTETRTLARVHPIIVQVSRDTFHGNDIEQNFAEYRELLSAWDNCYVYHYAALPQAVGKAKDIVSIMAQQQEYSSIPIVDADTPHICCTEMETTDLIMYGDAYIPCLIVMDTYGKILPKEEQVREYVYSDNNTPGIATLENGEYPSLIDKIRQFNKGKKPCYEQTPTYKLGVAGVIALTQHQQEPPSDIVPNVNISEQNERHRTILENKYKQVRLNYLAKRVSMYRKDFEESMKDFPNLNARFRDHLKQMLDSLNSDTSIACWLNEAIKRTEYMFESDDVRALYDLLGVSEALADYYGVN